MKKNGAAFALLLIVIYSSSYGLEDDSLITINGHRCVAGRIMVKMKQAANKSVRQRQNRERLQLMSTVQAQFQKKFSSGFELWRVPAHNTIHILEKLKSHVNVAYAEPDFVFHADMIPNDSFFNDMWALHNTGQSGGTFDADIDMPEAWERQRGDKNIIVGIIDSGIDYTHADVQDNIWINSGEIDGNGLDDDGNGYVDDIRGYDFDGDTNNPMDAGVHGTHVAGTIGAKTNNLIGTAGIAWNVQLLPLRFMDQEGRGSASDASEAVDYAVSMGADILNLSWGGTAFSQTLFEALARADSAGLLIVASAGNAATDNDETPHYPSSFELQNIIAVTASDHMDLPADFGNSGVESVDIAAPGVNIISTAPGQQYGFMSGSSMAAPHVSGVAVLVWSAERTLSAGDVKHKILVSADKKESLIGICQTAGRLNADAALTDSSENRLAVQPAYTSFQLCLVDHISPAQKQKLVNNSDQLLTIHHIYAPDGFLISKNGVPTNVITPFTLPPWSEDSLNVYFAPTQSGHFKEFIHINYSDDDGAMETTQSQLYGRAVSGAMVQPGSVSGIWSIENGPFYILGDVAVNGRLDIAAGVHVEFQGPFSFTVGADAVLSVHGTEGDSVLFNSYDVDEGWRGLYFLNTGVDDELIYSKIENCKKLNSTEEVKDQNGGAVYAADSSPTFKHCSFINNFALAGGAIYLDNSHPVIENSVILNNRALSDGGGGISCYNSHPQLFRVLIAGNRSLNFFADGDNGGGIWCWSSSPQLLNVTLAGNVADKGGGIYISQKESNPIIVNSILWDNIPNEAEFSRDPKSKSLVVAYSDLEGGAGDVETGVSGKLYWLEGNIDSDPNFVDADDSDYRLVQGSACIDAAIENTTLIYDNSRINIPSMPFLGAAPDMGACESFNVLPVELIHFSAVPDRASVRLRWATASEANNYGFEVQRSMDNSHFEKIGFVSGAGTTCNPESYYFTDSNVEPGHYSYRLKQIDFNGSNTLSGSVHVTVNPPIEFRLHANFPNPFNTDTKIQFDVPSRESVTISVFNANGQKISTLYDKPTGPGRHSISWNGTNDAGVSLASGLYFMILHAENTRYIQKAIILR